MFPLWHEIDLNSNCVALVPKLTYVWVVTSSTELSLLTKELFHRILTESFRLNILHALLKKELGRFNGRLNSKLEVFVRLPGEKHACPCILAEVSRSVFNALFPASQILKELHQELKSMKNVQKKTFIA